MQRCKPLWRFTAAGSRAIVALLALGAATALPRRAGACATCACGDPTLTVMGAQQPFAQRVRLSLEAQYRTDTIGRAGFDRIELNEQRTTLSAAYAPEAWLMVSASMPMIRRELTNANLARDVLVTPGDLELRARAFVLRDRAFAPRHLLALVGGARLPTAPLERDAKGRYRAPELQPGSGSFDPLGGVSYSLFAAPWSAYVSQVAYVPTQGPADFRIGASLRGTHALQYQVGTSIALRFSLEYRLEARARRAGGVEPDSGGFIAFASPSIVWSPWLDLVLDVDVHVPIWNALYGAHEEGVFAVLGAAYDL
jgi:hypothetical protein